MNGYEAMKAALYTAGLSTTEKIVLMALADRVDKAGVAYPSVGWLADMTGLNRRSVMRVLATLEDAGLIAVSRRAGRQASNIYRLCPDNWQRITSDTVSLVDGSGSDTVSLVGAQLVTQSHLTSDTVSPNKTKIKEEGEEAAALPSDNDIGNVYAAYQDNIGQLTPHISESIGDAIQEYSAGWVVDAIKVATEREKRNWRYILGVLRGWKREGRGEPSTANGNGEAAWQRVMEQIKAGQWSLPKDGPELATVRRVGGWPRFKEALDRDIPFLKREFLQEYHHGKH